MHGLGNDFVVIDNVRYYSKITPAIIKQLSNRHSGIGFDQLLIVEPPERADIDFNYRIFNQDGSEAEQCGNGARCFMRFVLQHGLTDKTQISVKTKSGVIELALDQNNQDHIVVNMGRALFEPAQIPFIPESEQKISEQGTYQVSVSGQLMDLHLASMGNPHAVVLDASDMSEELEQLGQAINRYPQFPQGVNLSFMSVITRQEIKLKVYERGSGITLACGTAACAAVAIGWQQHYLDCGTVTVNLPGGKLCIKQNDQHEILMSGPAEEVFQGRIPIE